MVCLNGTRAKAVSWLDARLIARFGVHGGIEPVDGPHLRAAETDDINHPQHPYLYEVWSTAVANRRELETYADGRDGTGIAAAIRFRGT